jgi:ComF family protein
MRIMLSLLNDLLNLLYPDVCYICGSSLSKGEEILCAGCFHHLPRTRFHQDPENLVCKSFWGRVEIYSATSFLYFRQGGMTQELLHRLKYKSDKVVGIYLGREFGKELLRSERYNTIDVIVPVPLHPRKQRKRGFNQSVLIARGIGMAMNVDVEERALVRKVHTSTQTRKNRFERWENVENKFSVAKPESIRGRHVLLIDDVITTGATMEACLQVLSEQGDITLSAASIAFATR